MKGISTTPSKISEDAIVISGISGLFPSADNILELSVKLYNKVDMVTSNVHPDIKHPELPQHYGKINGTRKFDAQFFRVTPNQALSFEPCGRKLMEQAYAAIFDAGVNPETLKGSKLGVFVGFSQSDSTGAVYDANKSNGYVMSGCSRTMLANRISYWIDAKGPSFAVDSACTSSMTCLEKAFQSIISEECDAALVAGCSSIYQPSMSLNMKRAGFLCLDGKTKCFDKNGDGYVRSEAVTVLFLQKAKDAKRIYAEICHVKGSYTSKPGSTDLPVLNPIEIQNFLVEFYSEVDADPDDVEYIEANSLGIAEADQSELEGTSKVLGKNKSVKIGSIKSNLGHTECASGVMSVIKACLAYQKGVLPANLHYTQQLDVAGIQENKFQVLTDNTDFKRGYIAVNNFGFPGTTYHALLKGHFIPKDTKNQITDIPHLVLVSGRTEETVNNVFDILEKNKIDREEIALLRNIFKYNIPGHTGRGFAIFDSQENESGSNNRIISKEFDYYSGTKKPVCFMYSGMGSQWPGMAEQLMKIPTFNATINKLHKILEPKGLNLVDFITNKKSDIASNIIWSLVGITAVHIGLTDTLKDLGVAPDLIIGHSLGEIGCAYADGCFTAEEAILVSYYRGFVSANTTFVKGKMAAVGVGSKKVQEIIPPDIDTACHNSSESTTISGPAEVVENFVECLTKQSIFAKSVASSDIAFHSRYITKAGPELLSLTSNLIKEPKRRSKKWISTSYAPEQWDLEESQLASAEYFTHNLLNKVLFDEGARYIPNDSIIIEIAPHGLMQAILKKSHASCLNLPLMRRNYDKNIQLLLESIGKLYKCGLNPKIEMLYPKVEFPVSTETSGISHLVQWDHSLDWDFYYHTVKSRRSTMFVEYIISPFDDEYSYLSDYFRNGENVFPESAFIELVWRTLAMYNKVNYTDLSVAFENIKFYEDVLINNNEIIKLCVSIEKGSHKFEVTFKDKLTVSGIINKLDQNISTSDEIKLIREEYTLDKNDTNKYLNMHGYIVGYGNLYIEATNADRSKAIIKWQNKWSQLINSLLLFNIISESEYTPCKIKYISNLVIDVKKHNDSLVREGTKEMLYAEHNIVAGVTRCGGIFCKPIFYSKISLKPTTLQVLSQEFIPYFCNYLVDMQTAVNVNFQIVYDNSSNEKLNVKLVQTKEDVTNFNNLGNIISTISLFDLQLDVIEYNDLINLNLINEPIDIIVFPDFRSSKFFQIDMTKHFNESTFFMLMGENNEIDLKCLANTGTVSVTSFNINNKDIILLKKRRDVKVYQNSILSSTLHHLKFDLQRNNQNDNIFILDNKSFINSSSYKDTVKNTLKKGSSVALLDVDEVPFLPFTKNTLLKRQVEKGLAINILRNEQWGGYHNIPLKSNLLIQNVELTTKENNIDKLRWTEMPEVAEVYGVQVCYSGLCMKDCKDILNDNKMSHFGMDFSGIDLTGRRVMGCVPGRAISSSVQADPFLFWPVPEHWSLEDAATVPLPYVHAFYCLTIKHVLKRNSTVLVTGGAGAFGHAVISLCLSLDCKVFTTVSSKQKKANLMRIFPRLKENDIGLSINTEFRDYVLMSTNSKCCNVVINCSVGAMRQTALACVASFGYFLDLSEEDMKNNESFLMGYLDGDKSYITVRLSSIFSEPNAKVKKMLHGMITEGIAKGIVKPLPRTVFPWFDISPAFKLMTTRQHTGRILINMTEDTSERNGDPRVTLNSNKVYVVICDESEIGVEIVNRLIERGAKKIVIQNTNKSHSGYYRSKYLQWRKLINIDCFNENLNSMSGCQLLIERGSKISPIDGIFYISSYSEANHDANNIIISNLDFVSRHIANLSYFVLVKIVPFKVCLENDDAKSDQRISERKNLGFPILNLKYRYKEMNFSLSTIMAFLDGFEKCLKHKSGNILLLDQKNMTNLVGFVNSKSVPFSGDNLSIFVENDEILASEPIVSMTTLTSQFDENEINLDPDDQKVIVISGFLGYHKTLSMATKMLKISAIGLHISPEIHGSVSELAENLLLYLRRRLRLKSKFYIVGYSFGLNVALEMAALLEKEGYHGTVFCLDSSPLALQHQLKAYIGHLTENKLQNFIIDHIFTQLTGTSSQNLKVDLEKCENWSDKHVAFINNIKKEVSLSHGYLKHLIDAVYKRILLAREYKSDLKLKSEIVLIKGLPDPNIDKLPDDYDLARYTSKPVKIVNVTSDHLSVPKDCKISNIINRMLEPELLKLFETKNLCETYEISTCIK